ncbi:MAG TPA: hypothetical protein VKU90_16580 [Caulobacteraceae bacterium]|nr:hypothetical protein [Caulobacteraceae bacterium]
MSLATPDVDVDLDARFLAQERIVDALLRALALNQPDLLSAIQNILVDTEFTHAGKPDQDETVHQQIGKRIRLAADFAAQYGSRQTG